MHLILAIKLTRRLDLASELICPIMTMNHINFRDDE